MFDSRDRSWFAASARQADAKFDCYFLLQTSLYVGDERQFVNDMTNVVDLPVPTGPVRDGFCRIRASEVRDIGGLGEHYSAVVNLARKHGKSFNDIRQHFWLRLSVEWPDDQALWFPWLDTWDQMDSGLVTLKAGKEWWDSDQGWESIFVKEGDWVYLRAGDGEGSEFLNVAFPADRLLASAEQLRSRMPELIAQLATQLGADVWTEYREEDALPRPRM